MALAAIGLDDVKRLKNATGTTVNDVVLAVCTGALRRFLLDGDELPDKPLVAVVPVSVQPDTDAPFGSNKVSTMFVQLPAHLDDPMERLVAIREGTQGAKEEHNALGADMLVNWAEHATPNLFAAAARLYSRMRLADRHRPIANLIISNVPGPGLPPLPGRRRDGRRLPARPGHGRPGPQHHDHELPGRPLLGHHRLPRDDAQDLEPGRGHPRAPSTSCWRPPASRRPTFRSDEADAGRRGGRALAPDRGLSRTGPGPAARDQPVRTAIEDAPAHTGIGRPNVPRPA